MNPTLFCLDAGTTAVKAAAFDQSGRIVAAAETPNSALRRNGSFVEQDMLVSRKDAFAALADCVSKCSGKPEALLVTGQGDGLWPIDADGAPVGRAMTWLDGRASPLVNEFDRNGALSAIEAVTAARPTAATQSLQLLWLQRHEQGRFDRIAHALRLKEWLFLCLTDALKAEPSSVLPTWGDWRTGRIDNEIEKTLGLRRGTALLPQLEVVSACRAGLSETAARALGLPSGLPVLIGPGDVQSTLIGLGLGVRDDVSRASVFGTSAIHASHFTDPANARRKPPGAMIVPFVLGEGFLCTYPCFNGATTFAHGANLFANLPASLPHPAYSGIVMQPFFEPGGERAPLTSANATASVFGLTAVTKPEELAWAAREALAYIARYSYEMMGVTGNLAVGGGLAGDRCFMQFLATATGAKVHAKPGGQAGLQGLAAVAAHAIGWSTKADLANRFVEQEESCFSREDNAVLTYANAKYAAFVRLLDSTPAAWRDLAAVRKLASEITSSE